MTKHHTYDAIMLGAGGAGLLLLDALRRSGWLDQRRILVIEPDQKADNDKTWCFWTDGNDDLIHAHGDIVTHFWDSVHNGMGRTDRLEPYRYAQIRSLDFYNKVKQLVEAHPAIEWLAASGDIAEIRSNGAFVNCGQDQCFGNLIFDSRPFTPEEGAKIFEQGDWMWQSFVGYRVKAENAFDAATCTLMDFNIPQEGQSQFVYILPTSSNEALIELTRFGQSCLTPDESHVLLQKYISDKAGAFEILETETGRIPMTLALNPKTRFHSRSEKVIPIGTRAGAVKSTTGYAFKFMAEHAEKIAFALSKEQPIPTAYHKKRLAFYDKILMRVLTTRPNLGKTIFQQLFKNRDTSEVLRFLDEASNFWQDLRILGVLPYRPFLGALAEITFTRKSDTAYEPPQHTAPKLALQDMAVIVIALVLVMLNFLSPETVDKSAPWLLLAGLVFPGIPHGAVDHWVALGKKLEWKSMAAFISKYLVMMGSIGLLWWMNPLFGLLLFLAYSAWHFGETDMREWKSYTVLRSWVWGISVLGVLLFGHVEALQPFLDAYGLHETYVILTQHASSLLAISVGGLFLAGWLKREGNIRQWAITSAILLIGLSLPLLLAFALYFIGCHSLRGWSHLCAELRVGQLEMVRKSLPFSLGAWAIAGILFFMLSTLGFSIGNIWPFAFVFIAAISGPHVYIMHKMYQRESQV